MRVLRPIFVFLLSCASCSYSGATSLSPRESLNDLQAHMTEVPALRGWELAASDGVDDTKFGYIVAISGGTVVVAKNCSNQNPRCTADHVYVFEEPTSGWSNMVQTAELSPSDGHAGDLFGTSVAVGGDTVVVGAQNGKAYIFVKPTGGWTNMTETAQLTDGITEGYGCVVAIDNQTIVIGEPTATINGNQDQGAAFVFVEPVTGWVTTSTFAAELTASDGTFSDIFGISAAVSGNTIVVGAPFYQDLAGPGAAYVFVEPETGWSNMTQTAELTRADRGQYDEFGLAVAIDRNVIVVGAQQVVAGSNGDGVVDIFAKPVAGWKNLTETAELSAPVSTQNFGHAVGISGTQVVVGTYSGTNAVFVYARPTGGWQSTSTPKTTLSTGQGSNFFGMSVGIDGHAIVAGAPDQSVNGHIDQGAAYVFGN